MYTTTVLSFVFLSVLSYTRDSQAILQYIFPAFFDRMFPRIERPHESHVPMLVAKPNTLSAQASTLAHNDERTHKGQKIISNTMTPHSVVHVPLAQKETGNLAQEIGAIDLPKTIEEALKKKKDTDGPVFVNINLNGQTVTKSSAIAHSTQAGDSVEWLHRLAHGTQQSCQGLFEWIKDNKKKSIFYGIISGYCGLQAYILYLGYTLSKSHCWSNWKSHCSLEELYRRKQMEFKQEIISEVRSRSVKLKKIDDAALLVTFLQEMEREVSLLERYRNLVTMLNNFFVGKIFFYNSKLYQSAADRINRLLFIKNTVLASISTDTAESFSPSTHNTN